MGFNKELFAHLLEKAKGNRSINQYARDADVSPAHISRLLRTMLDTPPSPEIINKLAQMAYNGVTYDELMKAVGHILPPGSASEPLPEMNRPDSALEKELLQIIISELYQSNYDWSIEKSKRVTYGPDITVRFTDAEYSAWHIYLKSPINIHEIFQLYGVFSTMSFTLEEKLSIAIDSFEKYELIIKMPPKSLKANLFVMLVDFAQHKIIKEEKLCSC